MISYCHCASSQDSIKKIPGIYQWKYGDGHDIDNVFQSSTLIDKV